MCFVHKIMDFIISPRVSKVSGSVIPEKKCPFDTSSLCIQVEGIKHAIQGECEEELWVHIPMHVKSTAVCLSLHSLSVLLSPA